MANAASRVRVVVASLPGLLYRISTPAGAGLTPRVVERGSRIRAVFQPVEGEGPDEVRIVLNRDVRWDIRLPAGGGEQQLDLAGGRITRVELGASGLVEMRLPAPVGTLPVTLAGSAGTVSLAAPSHVPLRIGLDRGAVSTVGLGRLAPAGGARLVFQSPTWRSARDRYVVRARSEVGTLILHRRRPPA